MSQLISRPEVGIGWRIDGGYFQTPSSLARWHGCARLGVSGVKRFGVARSELGDLGLWHSPGSQDVDHGAGSVWSAIVPRM